jgi:hypothetical protein
VNWTLKLKTYIAIIVDIGGLEKKPESWAFKTAPQIQT